MLKQVSSSNSTNKYGYYIKRMCITQLSKAKSRSLKLSPRCLFFQKFRLLYTWLNRILADSATRISRGWLILPIRKLIPHTHTHTYIPECSATILLYTNEGAGWSFLASRFGWWLTSRFMGSQKEKWCLLSAQADIVRGSHTLLTLWTFLCEFLGWHCSINLFKFLCVSEYWLHIIRLHSTALTNLMELGSGCDVHVVDLPNFLSYVFLFKNLKIQSRCRVRENSIMCNLCGEVCVCVCVCV